jgi:Nucleotidyl transferase AbiEii toxin, Type IV TA system
LIAAGFEVEIIPETSDLGEVFEGFAHDLTEFEVSAAEHATRLTLARFDRMKAPVAMEVGPVLDVEDVVGSKMAAMITRAEPRDFVDIAAATRRYAVDELLELARRADPSLTPGELYEALDRLDRLDDVVFTRLYGLAPPAVARLREIFADWPRA